MEACMNRREFMKGALAAMGFAALPGGFLFAAPSGWKHGGKPNLVFGVVSDTHIRATLKGDFAGDSPRKYLDNALGYFRRQNVDAVVHLGDMAHNGQVEAMQLHANLWKKAFPHDRAADGRSVVRLFITGNHDVEGFTYSNYIDRIIPDKEKQKSHLLITDMAGNWQHIWGEKYEAMWHKEVKGYHFYGKNWDVPEEEFATFVKKDAEENGIANCEAPVFLLTHQRLFYGFRKSVSPFRNALALFGHCHYSAANWNTIYTDAAWCKTFPSVQCPSCHAAGHGATLKEDEYIANAAIELRRESVGDGRQGFVVRVFDDMLTIERRDFLSGGSLGADWVMPLGKYDPHPFLKEELKKVIGEPQFSANAKPVVRACMVSDGAEDMAAAEDILKADPNKKIKAKKVPGIKVSIPLANSNPDTRVYAYEVEVAGDEGTPKLIKAVYAAGCNLGIGHELNHGVTSLEIPKSELPPGKRLTFSVRPLTSLGTSGRPIITDFKV